MPTHTNTFEGGLNSDVNVNAQPPGTYRDLHNGMLISYDGNHYSVETPKGNTVNFSIPPRYNGNVATLDTPALPIGMISFIDRLVIFSTNYSGYGEIGLVTFDNAGQGVYLPIYHDVSLNFNKNNQIHGFTYAENDKIKRVYWSDFLNEIRVINVENPLLTNYLAPTPATPLVNQTEYMVVNGAIEYPIGSGVAGYYGPGLPNGNLFTATTGGGLAYAIADNGNNPTGAPIVVQYLDYHLLSFNPDRLLGNIDFNQAISGSMNGGSKMFFYRLKLSGDGYITSWSYGSFPINISGVTKTSWKDQQGIGAGGVLANSGKGVVIEINGIDVKYDTIQIAMAEFDQKNNVLTDAKIVISTKVTSSDMFFNVLGGENLQALSVNDLTIFPASILTCKDLCTNKNYITIANLKERDEIDFDPKSVTIADTVYLIPADSQGEQLNLPLSQGTKYLGGGVVAGEQIMPDGHYLVSGGQVMYNGVTYGIGSGNGNVFIGAPITGGWTYVSGAPQVNGCIVIERYKHASGNPVNHVIPIYDYWDYKGMASTQYLRQYWTNETYRFGILFYDLKGNPYFVRWIGDHQIWNTGGAVPPIGISLKGGLLKNQIVPIVVPFPPFTFNVTFSSLQANGIKVSGINISADLATKISGFSIVRAPRDRQYLAQGILFPTVRDQLGNPTIHPMAECQLSQDDNYFASGSDFGTYTWHSPDQLCSSSVFIEGAGAKLEGEWFANTVLGSGALDSSSGHQETFNKFYGNLPSTNPAFGQPYSETITEFVSVSPNGTGPFKGKTFEDAFCRRSSDHHSAIGGNTVAIAIASGIHFNGSNDIASPSNAAIDAKPIANYKIPKSSLYGGQSPDAIANTPFISTGHFQPFNINDAGFIGTLPTVTIGGITYYQFNDVEVYGGDSFVSIMDHAKCMYDQTATNGPYSYGIFFPVESNVNHVLRQGRTLSRDGMQFSTDGIVFNQGGNARYETFAVNDAYTSDGSVFQYPALPVNFINTGNFPFRVRWAGPKISGENIDSFRIFLVNNYRDLGGNYGQINNVSAKKGVLYAWQDDAINYLPMLERQVVNGTTGTATQLGVGGVIDRFDVINSYFGNQHQNSLVDTEYGWSWFDMRRRAWLVMTTDGATQEISLIKGLQSFFNSVFENQYLPNAILSTDTPLVGIGICGTYDPQFKTTFLTFKNYDTNRLGYVNYDFTVAYNHTKNVIVGFFDFNPAIWHSHNRYLLSAKNISGPIIHTSTQYNIGNELSSYSFALAGEYICIYPFLSSSPVQPFETPGTSVMWQKMYGSNDIWTHWTGDLSKFYGRVYPMELEVIVNPNAGHPMTVDNLEIKSSQVNWDTITFSTDVDTAQDVNLANGNRNYRYFDGSWWSNVPYGLKGRLVDNYQRIRFAVKNFAVNPTVSLNKQKLVTFINSVFRIKR